MSIKYMSLVWDIQDLTPTEKVIMLAMADCADHHGKCWPTIYTIARKSSVAESTVYLAISKFEELGYLIKEKHKNRNTYYLRLSEVVTKGDQPQHNEEPPIDVPYPPTIGGTTSDHRRSIYNHHRTTIEPSDKKNNNKLLSKKDSGTSDPFLAEEEYETGEASHPLTVQDGVLIVSAPPPVPAAAPLEASPPQKKCTDTGRGTRYVEQEGIPAAWWDHCKERFGWSDTRISEVFEAFENYWLGVPGAKGRKANWLATWRVWCLRDEEKKPTTKTRENMTTDEYADYLRGRR